MILQDRIKELRTVAVAELRTFSGGNPKAPTEQDRDILDTSLAENGYVSPVIVWDNAGTLEILDGHTRVKQIIEKFPDTTHIKVLVLDVASREEGRLVILGLKNSAQWDFNALDAWMRDAFAEGLDVKLATQISGLTAADLDSIAEAGEQLLEDLDRELADRDDDDEKPTRTRELPEHVTFTTSLTRDQSADVSAALKLAKELTGCDTKGDALTAICVFYELDHRKRKKRPKKRKSK